MANEYSRRKVRKNRLTGQLFQICGGFLAGYLVANFFDVTSLTHWVNSQIFEKQVQKKTQAQTAAKGAELPKPKFEFYTLLAKDRNAQSPHKQPVQPVQPVKTANEIPAVETVATKIAAAPALSPENKPIISSPKITKETYLVQLASFRKRQDAENLKASLVLKGFEISITPSVQQQITWFRVVAGPFQSKALAEKTQLVLAQNERIKGMVRRA